MTVTSHPIRHAWWFGVGLLALITAMGVALVVVTDRGADGAKGGGSAPDPLVIFPTEVPSTSVGAPVEAVHVDSVRYAEVPRVGSTFAFPRGVVITPGQASELDDLQGSAHGDYAARARQLGGVAPHDVAVQIALRGASAETAVITDMRALSQCGDPLTGTLLYDPPAGEDVAPQIGFDLDRPSAPAQVYTAGDLTGSYFLDRTVSVKPGETQVLLVHGVTASKHCRFSVELTVNAGVGAAGIKQVVDDGGKPFEVTAIAEPTSAYERVYAGGVAAPAGDGRFAEVDPATYER